MNLQYKMHHTETPDLWITNVTLQTYLHPLGSAGSLLLKVYFLNYPEHFLFYNSLFFVFFSLQLCTKWKCSAEQPPAKN